MIRRHHAVILTALALLAAPAAAAPIGDRVARVLAATPLIDGHNDWPWALRPDSGGPLTGPVPDLTRRPSLHTDLARLKSGRVGGQFWSVWVPVSLKGADAVQATLEQIDLVHRFVAAHPGELALARTAADVRRIHKAGRVASLIGVEGGHSINNSLAVLRQLHGAGAGYLTLAHSANTDWVDSATDVPKANGLTPFGLSVIAELNRLGMLVDLSHVSDAAMTAALAASKAPVIFSHSSARALNDHPRNVPDAVLRRLPANGGVVMVNYYPVFIDPARRRWQVAREGEVAKAKAATLGQLPAAGEALVLAWEAANPRPVTTLAMVADHIEHIRKVAGIAHVGLGADLDGVPDLPAGLEGVDTYPALLAELARRGWSDAELAALAGENVLRVMARAEAVAMTFPGK